MNKLKLYRVYFKFNKPVKYDQNNFMTWQLYRGTMKWAGDKQMWEIIAEDLGADDPNETRKIKYYSTISEVEESWELFKDSNVFIKPHQAVSIEHNRKIKWRRNSIRVHKNKKLDHKRLKLLYLADLLSKEKELFPFSPMYIKYEGKGHLLINKNNLAILIKDEWNKVNISSQEEL